MNRAVENSAELLCMGEYNQQSADQWSWNQVAEKTLNDVQMVFESIVKMHFKNLHSRLLMQSWAKEKYFFMGDRYGAFVSMWFQF